MKNNITKKLAVVSLLIAANIVLSRLLSIQMWNMKFSFSFLSVAIAASLYGIWGGAVVGGIGDLLGSLLFPTGAYFPGFTLTAVLVGVIYGIFYKGKTNLFKITLGTLISNIVGTILLNSLWISILYKSQFVPLMVTRLTQAGIMSAIQIIVLYIILVRTKLMDKIK